MKQFLQYLVRVCFAICIALCRVANAQESMHDRTCPNLDAAVREALDAQTEPAQLETFGWQPVHLWRTRDFDDFLDALERCSDEPETAPTLYAFHDEAQTLLIALRRQSEIAANANIEDLPGSEVTAQPDRSAQSNFPPMLPHGTSDWDAHVSAVENELQTLERLDAAPEDAREKLATLQGHIDSLHFEATGFSPARARVAPLALVEQLSERANQLSDHWARARIAAVVPEAPAHNVDSKTNPATTAAAQTQIHTAEPQSTTHAPATQQQKDSDRDGAILAAVLACWFVIVCTGCVAGWGERIVVFRNYDDLALVFFVGFSICVGLLLSFHLGNFGKWVSYTIIGISVAISVGLVLTTIIRTWSDNPSWWKFALALITKISLAALFLFYLVQLISPGGKSQAQRGRNRASALGMLILLAPVVYSLVRDKTGIWAPRDVISPYHRRRLGV